MEINLNLILIFDLCSIDTKTASDEVVSILYNNNQLTI